MTARFAYPVALDLHGVPVLVVGAGPVAARKVAGLTAAGARVRVVAPEVSAAMAGEVDAATSSASTSARSSTVTSMAFGWS